ncbi:hypothetical protein C8Q78DRAFT_1064710 [Trametes maxima]|nr:hypothetical protein C8Q78DRAFT_1064710 [Trametes maxima]
MAKLKGSVSIGNDDSIADLPDDDNGMSRSVVAFVAEPGLNIINGFRVFEQQCRRRETYGRAW